MPTSLVTGGAGFIGSNLARLLLERGDSVTVLDNLSSGHRENLASLDVAFVEGDIRDPSAIDRAMAGADVVFHLAASVGNTRSIEHPILDSEINVLGTLQVLEGARRHGVRKVVLSSSAGIFGELKTLPIAEDHPVEPDTPYGASKLAAEKLCLAYAKLHPVECVCLRYFNVYGEHQRYDAYGNVIPIFVHRALRGEPVVIYGDGEQTRDFVHVRDVAQANWLAGQSRGVSGAFNIASGSRITINELAGMVAESVGNVRVEHAEPRAGDVRHSLADISRAHEAFGYTATVDLTSGVPAYIQWVRTALG